MNFILHRPPENGNEALESARTGSLERLPYT
jgi:hypothetical protein